MATMPASETNAPAATEAPAVTEAPVATVAPTEPPQTAEATRQPETEVSPTNQPTTEKRVVELEWPESMRLGDSDVIRLSLFPSEDGYTAQAEYEEHVIATSDIHVQQIEGYTLSAAARLDGAGFDISPAAEQSYQVTPGEALTWRWSLSPRSAGQQRISIVLLLRWEPQDAAGAVKESVIYNRSLDIRVTSFLGMRKPAALAFGFGGMAFSFVLGGLALGGKRRLYVAQMIFGTPNPALDVESAVGMTLNLPETDLMKTLFAKYRRLLLLREFQSGYSGARTFLARPVKQDGNADAETIIKIGPDADILNEYDNYDTFVKDRLPPLTARIQSLPVTVRGVGLSAIQYTCISEPGKLPVSLRQALLENPNPALIRRLFDSFGPYWWLQRQPYTFRAAQEYDRLLPPHLVLQPEEGNPRRELWPTTDPQSLSLEVGALVKVPAFARYETRADGRSLTLFGEALPGRLALRVRWLNKWPPSGTSARVVARRSDLFAGYTRNLDLCGLPDPLPRLDEWLNRSVSGMRSVIHGDLNLENILVGPGSLVWLIDFAQTREGHPLFDFSHLASELIAHVLVERYPTAQQYLAALRDGSDSLLAEVQQIAAACQFDSKDPAEYTLALTLACLGALKYNNLGLKARQFLYVSAAYYGAK